MRNQSESIDHLLSASNTPYKMVKLTFYWTKAKQNHHDIQEKSDMKNVFLFLSWLPISGVMADVKTELLWTKNVIPAPTNTAR